MVRALVLIGPDSFELRDLPPPQARDDNAIVRVELCGNCGTDVKYASGKLAAPIPMILGHEIVGRVEHIGTEAARRYGVAVGDRVIVESSIPCWSCAACRSGAYRMCPTKGGYGTRSGLADGSGLWGGLAEVIEVAPGSIVHHVPEAVSPEAAIGMELLANGYQWLIRKGGLQPGQRVLIQGCGPQGLAASLVARRLGATGITMTGLASDEARLAFAAAAGIRTVVIDPEADRDKQLDASGGDYDVVLDVTGDPRAVATAADHLRPQGTLVLASIVGRGVDVPFRTDDLAYREIRVQGVLSKDEASVLAARSMVETDVDLRGRLERLITHVFPLEGGASAINARSAGLPGFVKAAVRPNAADAANAKTAA
ncbi:MAG TPA: zinc-binding dehydrogenase [Candidatus Limnocylindrales bacterium]|nr:zinc-binding dehydrogenase [Candidatus Limnocylindrales bacterium]